MERLSLSIAFDSFYKKNEIEDFLKDIVQIFDIEDRVYSLEREEEKIPSILFSFGDLDGEKFSKVQNNINSDSWKSASKKIAKIISKHGKKSESILIFEWNYKKVRVRFACRTKESKMVKSAMKSLDRGIDFLIQIFKSKDIPSTEMQIHCGFDKKDNSYKIDRAVTFTPEFIEYAFDEIDNKWIEIKLEKN